jgi:hypothetical protein
MTSALLAGKDKHKRQVLNSKLQVQQATAGLLQADAHLCDSPKQCEKEHAGLDVDLAEYCS